MALTGLTGLNLGWPGQIDSIGFVPMPEMYNFDYSSLAKSIENAVMLDQMDFTKGINQAINVGQQSIALSQRVSDEVAKDQYAFDKGIELTTNMSKAQAAETLKQAEEEAKAIEKKAKEKEEEIVAEAQKKKNDEANIEQAQESPIAGTVRNIIGVGGKRVAMGGTNLTRGLGVSTGLELGKNRLGVM